MSKLILSFLNDDSAATSIEYALIAGGVSIVVIGVVNTIGTQLNSTLYGQIATALK
jgi:pilus assembly protein Flp/PilA